MNGQLRLIDWPNYASRRHSRLLRCPWVRRLEPTELKVRVMNKTVEVWSMPWHELQRSLAEAFGTEAIEKSVAAPKSRRAHVPTAAAVNWLVRARHTPA